MASNPFGLAVTEQGLLISEGHQISLYQFSEQRLWKTVSALFCHQEQLLINIQLENWTLAKRNWPFGHVPVHFADIAR